MKNVLLCLLALTIAFSGYSQRKPVIKGDVKSHSAIKTDRIGWEPVKTKPITTSTVTVPSNLKNAEDVNFVTIVSIGTSANAYSYGYAGGQKSILYANNDINTVSHFHRMGGALDPGGYSGDLGYDVSFDGGMTWTNQIECYRAVNNAGGTYYTDAGRYPNHGIYNPEGNTDPDNAYLTYFVPTLDGSNSADAWGGYGYGRARFGDLNDTIRHLDTSVPPYYLYIPDAYDVSNDGITITVDVNQDWSTGTVAYQGSLTVSRGVWDEGLLDFVVEKSLIDFPTNAENDRPVHVKFAFGPDGQTGWIVVITDNASVEPLVPGFRYYYPVFIKTTDGGLTWEDPISVRLDGPDGLYGVLNYLTDQQITDLYEPPAPARDEIPYTTAFDCDIVVDSHGNPHLGVIVGVGASTEYSIISAPEYFSAFDIFTLDGGATWDSYSAGKLKQFRGTFGTDYSEDNRIQISSTQDGSRVFLTWLDTWLEGAEENNAPDIFCRGIEVNYPPMSFKFTVDIDGNDLPSNVTTFSEAMWQSYFAITSRYSLVNEDGNFVVPISYEALTTPFDPALPVQYKYIQDFTFETADFAIVGVDEKENNSIASVSQNYPNPFSQSSTVSVNLDRKTSLKLVVTNLLGQQVMQMDRGDVPAGSYDFVIDGSKLDIGIYFYTVYAGKETVTNKMIVE